MAKKTEWTVSDREGTVTVAKLANDRIRITWLCGDTRTFSADGLEAAIDHVERMAEVTGDVPVTMKDTPGYGFNARLDDGRLYAANAGQHGSQSVKWDGRQGFRCALERAIKAARPGPVARAKQAVGGKA